MNDTKISLREFKRREAEFASDLNNDEGFMIRPVRILKTNARMATHIMNMVHFRHIREKDAILIMIPWLRAAIDLARDSMDIEEIREIVGLSVQDYRRFLFSANSLVHAYAFNTLERAMPPRHVDCSIEAWRAYCQDCCSKSFVLYMSPKMLLSSTRL